MLEPVKKVGNRTPEEWTRIVSLEHTPETLEDAKKIIEEVPPRTHILLEREISSPPLINS